MNDYSMSAGGVWAIFVTVWLAVLGFALVITVAVYVLNGFAFMALFRKVGVEPWAAWVPFFNQYRILELGGQEGLFILFALIPSIGATIAVVFECLAVYRINLAFRKDGSWVVLFIFLPFVWAWLLAAGRETYDPAIPATRGYGPPKVGYGSPRGPWVRPPAAS